MVKIRVTVTVLPEDVYLAAQDGHLASAARSAQARKFMVPCESPEAWTIGQFANRITDAYSKTYRGEDLGTIKYIKDEDDADLHTDLSVYDALVNAGDEAMNIRDQRAKITVIQEQGLPLRGSSVLPDLSAPRYQIPRPPPPPLFSDSPQVQAGARKRSSDAAFGGEASSAHWARIPPNQRARPAATSVDPGEYSLVASVEHDTLEENDRALSHWGEASVDRTQDAQLPSARRAANFESPDPQVPLQHFKPTSRFSAELFDTATNASQNVLKAAPYSWPNGQGDVLRESYDDRTQKQIPRGYASVPYETESPASRKAVALAAPTAPEVLQASPATNSRLRNQAQLETWQNRPNPPITPPSDASPADLRRRLAQPAPKSLSSSAGATRASNKFKPPVPRLDVFEPHSSIEDSQMSPRSKEKSRPDVHTEAALKDKTRRDSRSVPKAGKAKAPFSEVAQLFDQKSPMISGNHARNEPGHTFSETPAFLGDADDHERQTYQEVVHDELEATVAVYGTVDDELSTDQSLADSQDKNKSRSKASSSPTYHHSLPARSDSTSASSSRESSESADQTDGDSNKENRHSGHHGKSSDMQMHDQTLDADMENASSEEEVDLSASHALRPNQRFQDAELSAKTVELPTNPKDKCQTTIDILNGGGLVRDALGDIGDFSESKQSLRASVGRSGELQKVDDITAKRHRRKKKSRREGRASQPVPEGRLHDSDPEQTEPKTDPKADVANGRKAEDRYGPGKIKVRPNPQTPTSTGSAGDQLQENLQASTLEPNHTTEAARFPVSHSRFSIPSPIPLDGRPIRNKVYEGVVKENEGTSAVIELQGVKGNPCGLLHKNGAAVKHFSGPISQILALGQVVKVKVTQPTVTKGSDTFAKLSMLNINQATGEFVQPSVVDDQTSFLRPAEDRRNVNSDRELPKLAGDGKDSPNLQVQADINRANKADIKDGPVTNLQESDGEARYDSAGTDTNVNDGGDVEITHGTDRAETPDNQGPPELYFGLGSTNTPRKRKERAASLGEAESSIVPSAVPVVSGRGQTLIEISGAPLPNAGSSTFEEAVDDSPSQNGASRTVSAPHSKNKPIKSRSKTKAREKQSKSRGSMKRVAADTEQDNNHLQDESNVSRKESNLSPEQNVQLLEKPTETTKMEVADEEYIAFPPTMTREQFLAQRQANAAAIARRNAAATQKSGVAKSSGPAKAQPVQQSSMAKATKLKEKPDSWSPLSAVFETAPDKKTSKNKQSTVEKRSSGGGPDAQTHTQKQSRSQLDSISGEQNKNTRAVSTESRPPKKSQHVERASTESSELDSQTTATPTPSKSISPNQTKSSQNSSPAKSTNASSDPKGRDTDSKAVRTTTVTPKAAHARQSMNSKALSLAELKARKEAAKKLTTASSRSLPPYKSNPNTNVARTPLTVRADSDSSESESESESSSDNHNEKSGAAARTKKAFQKVVSRPDPTIRDRSMSIDVGDDEE